MQTVVFGRMESAKHQLIQVVNGFRLHVGSLRLSTACSRSVLELKKPRALSIKRKIMVLISVNSQ